MRYLSLCSGIEAASVAWHSLGWTPVGFSEIEPFPSAVLAHRFPNVPNYGDMTQHEQWPIEPGSIDLLVAGTPCQSFSIAGLRQGLKDPRGGLMLTYLEIAQRLRPRWVVWENVVGCLSSNGGKDFGSFLGALVELGYDVGYRILDAQWVRTHGYPRAVPQRRRRVFVVGRLLDGSVGDRTRAAKVLFESQSLLRNYPKGRGKKQKAPGDVGRGTSGGGGYGGSDPNCCDTVTSKWLKGSGGPSGNECGNLVSWPADCAGTLQSGEGSGHPGYSNQEIFSQGAANLVPQTKAYRWQNDRDGLQQDDATAALRASMGGSGFHEMNHPVIAQPVPYDLLQITAPVNRQNRVPGDPCHTLARENAAHAAVVNMQGSKSNACVSTDGTSFTLNAMHGHDVHAVAVAPTLTVRRLTNRECERLQGFPDDWTLIPYRGKPAEQCPDGPRYKALGNSFAVNCIQWIGERIAAVEAEGAHEKQ
jgi:DNA (cytosine-5)-methyltransferase 1